MRSPEFAKINPARKVPAILDGDFNLSESHTIIRYLARKFNVSEQWYPRTDHQKCARVEEYMDFHHTGTRKCSNLVFWTAFAPLMGLTPPKSFNKEQAHREVQSNLKFLCNRFLKNTPFISSEHPTVADLSAYEEILQLSYTDYDLSAHPQLKAWMGRMEAIPEVAEENKIFFKLLNGWKAKFSPSAKM